MITRYENKTIKKIWSLATKGKIWIKIEKLVLKYWYQEKLFSFADYQKLLKVEPDLVLWKKWEEKIHHEVGAFVAMLSEVSDPKLGKWWHYGLTSNDIIDTGQNYLLKMSYQILVKELNYLLSSLKEKAFSYKKEISLGRTHGIAAEPITIGWKFALWYQEFSHHLLRCQLASEEINYVKILGPTGISAHFSLDLGIMVAKELKMKSLPIASQVMSRDHYIAFFNALTNLATSLEKIVTEIRNLARSEIDEMREGFTDHQQGSSAMPHKKNPILAENISSLMKMARTLNEGFYHTNLLWHERDLTNSALERNNIPDFFHLLATGLKRTNHLLATLTINQQAIKKNLLAHQFALFSHKVLLALIKKTALNRQQAYALVQQASFLAKKEKKPFLAGLKAVKIFHYLDEKTLEKCFDLKSFFSQLDRQFQAVFK